MLTTSSLIVFMPLDDKREGLNHDVVETYVEKAVSIYQTPYQEIQQAAFPAFLKSYLFEDLPVIFNTIAQQLEGVIEKNEDFDAESYRLSRIFFDKVKPSFETIKDKKLELGQLNEKEKRLYCSLTEFKTRLGEYLIFLEDRFVEMDKPKFKSYHKGHISASELWNMRNPNYSFLV